MTMNKAIFFDVVDIGDSVDIFEAIWIIQSQKR